MVISLQIVIGRKVRDGVLVVEVLIAMVQRGIYIKSSVLEVGKSYKLDFEITNVTSGTLYLASNKYETQETFSSNGSYSVFIVPKTVNLYFYSLGFNGSIDNVSVVEVGQDWDFNK